MYIILYKFGYKSFFHIYLLFVKIVKDNNIFIYLNINKKKCIYFKRTILKYY